MIVPFTGHSHVPLLRERTWLVDRKVYKFDDRAKLHAVRIAGSRTREAWEAGNDKETGRRL